MKMGLLEDLRSRLFRRESRGLFNKKNSSTNILDNNNVFSRYSRFEKINPNVSYKESLEILDDDQVKVAYLIFTHILCSKKYNLSSPDDNTEVLDFIDNMFKDMKIEVIDIVKYILTGVLYGFSANELMFNVNEEQKLVIQNVIPINQSTLENKPFNFDDNGDVVSIHQTPPNDKAVDIPVDKILLYSYDKSFDNPYGRGVLRQLKPIIREKKDLNNWLMTDSKRHASPLLVGKSDNHSSRNAMLDAFDDVNAGATGITVGLDETIESVGGNGSADDYKTVIQMKDNQILRLFFIPDLLMSSNTTGSYAQSNTQLNFLYIIYNGILEDIANTIQRQIINPIIEFNYGNTIKAPVFSFDKFDETDYKTIFEIINGLINTGTLASDNQAVHETIAKLFRSTVDVEYNQEDSEIVEDFSMPPVNGETATEDILNSVIESPLSEEVDNGT
jgi:hypothetical protein